jgi:hypothetical protein
MQDRGMKKAAPANRYGLAAVVRRTGIEPVTHSLEDQISMGQLVDFIEKIKNWEIFWETDRATAS